MKSVMILLILALSLSVCSAGNDTFVSLICMEDTQINGLGEVELSDEKMLIPSHLSDSDSNPSREPLLWTPHSLSFEYILKIYRPPQLHTLL